MGVLKTVVRVDGEAIVVIKIKCLSYYRILTNSAVPTKQNKLLHCKNRVRSKEERVQKSAFKSRKTEGKWS